MELKYKNSLLKICDFLVSDPKKSEYIINCYWNQEVLGNLNKFYSLKKS